MSVQRRDRHLVQPLTHSRVFCVYTGCLSKDVTGSLYSLFLGFFALTQCICPRTWQVTVLFTALLYQGPLFIWLLCFLFISLLLFAFTQCVCPKTWQVTVLFTALLYQGPSFYPIHSIFLDTFASFLDFLLLSFHSVSVQRRGRYSVSHFDLIWSLYYLFFLLFAQCVCPKTWQVLCFLLFCFACPLFLKFSFSLLVTQCICPKTWQGLGVLLLIVSLAPFCFPLLSSGYTVYLSKGVTGALLPIPLTSFLFWF